MKLPNIVNGLNNKRLTITLQLADTSTHCEIYCESAKVFIKRDKSNNPTELVFMNEDFEQIAIDIATINSFLKKDSTYIFNCGNHSVMVE